MLSTNLPETHRITEYNTRNPFALREPSNTARETVNLEGSDIGTEPSPELIRERILSRTKGDEFKSVCSHRVIQTEHFKLSSVQAYSIVMLSIQVTVYCLMITNNVETFKIYLL